MTGAAKSILRGIKRTCGRLDAAYVSDDLMYARVVWWIEYGHRAEINIHTSDRMSLQERARAIRIHVRHAVG